MINDPLLIIRLQSEVPKEVVVLPEAEVVPVVVVDEAASAHEVALADGVVLGVVPVDGAVSVLEVVVRPGAGVVSGEGDNKVYQEDMCDRFSSIRLLWICTCTFILTHHNACDIGKGKYCSPIYTRLLHVH